MDEQQMVGTLMKLSLFEGLDFNQIANIRQACNQREVEPGTVLCEPLTIDERLLIFVDGKLRLESADGVKLAEVTEIRVIGEMGVLTGQSRTSRVVAEEPSSVLELEAAELEKLIDAEPELGNQMLVNLCKLLYARVHDMNEDIVTLREEVDRLRSGYRN